MKNKKTLFTYLLITLSILISSSVFAQNPAIIPLPKLCQWGTSSYTLPANQIISYNSGGEKTAVWLGKLLEKVNTVSYSSKNANWQINLDATLVSTLGKEGYMLDITAQGVKIQGGTETGLFYAIQSLRQMLPEELEKHVTPQGTITLTYVHIQDSPLYPWRGCSIDIARRFIGLTYLKQHVDRMALYKLNRLHLHLTDDQGWRIEMKSKPDLTTIGSKSAAGNGSSGFLTQADYAELQNYALERQIILIPEIDMPGHIYAALASYPTDLNCTGNSNLSPLRAIPPAPYTGTSVGWSKFCMTKPGIYDFVSTIINELASITKGPWIHMGGDEISDPLYGTFIHKADSIVRSTGKITIGWEEISKENVNSAALAQVWNGQTTNSANCNTIISICNNFYLDHGNVPNQKNTNNWCQSTGVSIDNVYNFKMGSSYHNPQGVEAAIWSEFVEGDTAFDNRLWPRLMAVAEVAWTAESQRVLTTFKANMALQGKRLDFMGVGFFKTPGIPWVRGAVTTPATNVFDNYITDLNVLTTTGLDDKGMLPDLKNLYPNPASDEINFGKMLYEIEIFNNAGQIVLEAKNGESMNIRSLNNGIYHIHAQNGQGKFSVVKN